MNAEQEMRTIDNNGLPLVVTYSNWDTGNAKWERYGESELFHNANGNLTLISTYEFTSGTRNIFPTFIRNYYYEYYFNVGVAGAEEAGTITVYPNPATDHINIVLGELKNVSITLTHTSGQTVRTINVPDNTGKASLSTGGLPAGNYILQVMSSGAAQGRQLITIQ